jgi:endonuclease/exonuclease/phosphatase family metal-dependent hydrolase
VVAIYAPEASQNSCFITELETLFRCLNLNSDENYFLLAGDYNAKHQDWGNQLANPRGTQLFNWLGLHSIECKVDLLATDRPSYPRSGSYLDLLLLDSRLKLTDDILRRTKNCLTTVEYDSDHCGLAAVILLPNDLVELEEYVPTHSYNYGKTR